MSESDKLGSIDSTMAALFEGIQVEQKDQDKFKVIIEAAVSSAVSEEVSNLTEEYEVKLQDTKNELFESMSDTINVFLEAVVSEWTKENKPGIESDIKVNLAESILSGVKDLVESHEISVDESEKSLLESHQERIEELETELFESQQVIDDQKIDKIKTDALNAFSTLSEGLTDTQKAKFEVLVENITVTENFASQIKVIKETFFQGNRASSDQGDQNLNESLNHQPEDGPSIFNPFG